MQQADKVLPESLNTLEYFWWVTLGKKTVFCQNFNHELSQKSLIIMGLWYANTTWGPEAKPH